MAVTPYRYGIKNRYTPTHLIKKAYGWSGSHRNLNDVPSHLMTTPMGMTSEEFRQQFAYEWLHSNEVGMGYSNPPFASGASGRLLPFLQTAGGVPARIQRGYIRRGEVEAGKDISKARLYFMFNPETITRDYVSYLDQTALDPFNTVYQSSNLVAPPSILDFSFSLFFDRAEEAMDADHPGVFVDYQFFDLVVRNVTPDDPNSTGNTLPDNGVMMVNPREITVIFSQQLTVQGRPLNARVSFIKFTHRMVPTRMQIDLTVRATYLGPLRPQTTYTAEEWTTADTIPLGAPMTLFQHTNKEVTDDQDAVADGATSTLPGVSDSAQNIINSSANVRLAALKYAMEHTRAAKPNVKTPGVTKYGGVEKRSEPMGGNGAWFEWVDCSSFVSRSYVAIGAAAGMKWTQYTDTNGMLSQVNTNKFNGQWKDFNKALAENWIKPGDLVIRPPGGSHQYGHVAFVAEFTSGVNHLVLFAARSHGGDPQVGQSSGTAGGSEFSYKYVLRPEPTGWTSQTSNAGGGNGTGYTVNPSTGAAVPS